MSTVTKYSLFNCQVCVPQDWTDDQVLTYAEQEFPCGTENGWQIEREGDPLLNGAPERVPCEKLPDHVHIMLAA